MTTTTTTLVGEDEVEIWSGRVKRPARSRANDISGIAQQEKKYPGQSNPELAEKSNFCGVM